MEELLNYIQKRQERIKKLKEIELARAEECTSSIESLYIGLKELTEKSCSAIKQIDKDNNLRNYLEEQTRNMHLQFRMRVQNRQEELARAKGQLLKDTAKYNVEELIELSDKIKNTRYNNFSNSEKAFLRFIDSFHNYRLAAQYGEIQGDNRLEKAQSEYNVLKSIGAEKLKKTIARLIQRGILTDSDKKPLSDMLKEIKESSKSQHELEEREDIKTALKILEIEDKKIREKITDNCRYADLEKRINAVEELVSQNASYAIFKENPSLFLESRERFDLYISKLKSLRDSSSQRELSDTIVKRTKDYSSLDSLESFNNEADFSNKEERSDYNLQIADIVLSILKVKGSIGGSYIPLQHLRKTVFGKISEKYEAEEFDSTIKAMARAGALIRHTKKSATDAPISINPHLENIYDEELREKVRATLANGRN